MRMRNNQPQPTRCWPPRLSWATARERPSAAILLPAAKGVKTKKVCKSAPGLSRSVFCLHALKSKTRVPKHK
jgi:hypothetical protein